MLKRKMFRDIKNNISQYITIFLMVLIGLFAYSGIRAYTIGMSESATTYYEEYNLQELDAFGMFKESDIEQISKIKHINRINAKLTLPNLVTLESDNNHKLQMNFIEENSVSKFYIKEGSPFYPYDRGCYIDAYYALKNNLHVGDKIKLMYGDINFEYTISAIVYIPDRVYATKDASVVFPSYEDFGIIYASIYYIDENIIKNEVMNEMNIKDIDTFNSLFPNFNYRDYLVFNSLMVDIDDIDNLKEVKKELEKNKGVDAVLDIRDEQSYKGYQSEIDEGEAYVGIFSGLFIFIAVLSVLTTMTRVIKNERSEIATLKSLGFTDRRILFHYISYTLFISLLGIVLGIILGYYILGNFFMKMQMEYWEIPEYHSSFTNENILVGFLVLILVAIFTLISTKSILKETPAEAIRPIKPKIKTKSLNITNKGIFKHMPFSTIWNIRDILRNKIRTILGIVGVVGCMILMVSAFGMNDTLNNFIKIQFEDLYNFKYKLNLDKDSITDTQLDDLKNKYGNNTSETLLIEMKLNGEYVSNNIFVDDTNNYIRNIDPDNEYLDLKNDGIYITRKLAEINNIELGDIISWHIYGEKEDYNTKVIGFNVSPQNQNLTMNLDYLNSLGIKYKPDSLYTNKDLSNIKRIDGVSSIQGIDEMKSGINKMLDTMRSMIWILIFFGALLGIIIISNMGILSFTEKNREFATLKVLGFSNEKISKIFIKQNIWITIIAILIGIPLGYYVLDYLFKEAIGDEYDFKASINMISYIYSVLGTYIVAYLTLIILSKKIKKIDMVTSLKGNE